MGIPIVPDCKYVSLILSYEILVITGLNQSVITFRTTHGTVGDILVTN